MIKEYPILLLLIAILVSCCSYFFIKKVGRYYDSGKKPYLTRNLYIIGPSSLLFASLLFFNLGLGLMGLSSVYMQFFQKNNFERVARNIESIDGNLSNPQLNVYEKNKLLVKKKEFIEKIENGSLNDAVRVNLDVGFDDPYEYKNYSKELISVVNHSLAKAKTKLEGNDD